jgi:aminotransferase
VLEAAKRAIGGGHNSYTRFDGIARLKEAIANRCRAYNQLPITPDNVLVTSGATGAFECICRCFIEPGDEVVVLEPAYQYHILQVIEHGGIPRYVRLHPPDWTVDSEELRRAINARTKLLVMSNPNNPTGRVFSREELETIGSICRSAGVIVVSDEVYEYILAEGYTHTSMASLPGMFDHTLTLSSASKTFFVTGWRVGWIIGPTDIMPPLGVKSDQTYVCAPAPLQEAVADCLGFGDDFFQAIALPFRQKCRQLCSALKAAGFEFRSPEGAYYILAEYDKLRYGSDVEAMKGLVASAGVGAVPGNIFFPSMENTGELRFCFALTDDLLNLACERLSSQSRP